ncbi:hypothetical protein [Aeromicrobium sp. IC_218]|uniref:hypothetical protein n=1 Tax=Aeromicrobium sp. IC_218 TaxID=2545468 RepID=UPI0010388A80|nr:hypothetical protein [Aeromicrobium sp. IC_218]TCI97395.1 hypothetical protein E0W78_12550 [Aeromicrobium sp. IC_218]
MSEMNVMLSTLHLVYPPVSSYEADSVKVDPEVEALLRGSDFYVMAMRPEVVFDDQNIQIDGAEWTVPVLGQTHGGKPIADQVTLDIARFASDLLGEEPESITAEAGPKMLRFWAGTMEDFEADQLEGPFEWFTTEKLLHDKGRGVDGITGLDRHRDLATYELLYVGIAKKTDTFDRLFERAHHARQKILSGEWPRRSGARVTDELILFPFRVEPTILRTLELGDEPTDTTGEAWAQYKKQVVADAEKAFVHLLDPQYNVEKFASYPKGADGLYGGDHQRYGYLIAENVTFTTANGTMRGSFDPRLGMFDDSADWIFVSGDEVELVGPSQGDT